MENKPHKSKARAIVCFVFSLLSLLPLINYITIPISIYLGYKSLKNIKKDPNTYGGKAFSVIGLIISILILIFTLTGVGICLAGNKDVCRAMGFVFLS